MEERPDQPVRRLLAERPAELGSVGIDALAIDALQIMAEHRVGAVAVLDGRRPAGILSEHDFARAGLAHPDRASAGLTVREVMTPLPVHVTPADTVSHCLAVMTEHGLDHLPVLDKDSMVGLVSINEVLRATISRYERVLDDVRLEKLVLFARGTYSC